MSSRNRGHQPHPMKGVPPPPPYAALSPPIHDPLFGAHALGPGPGPLPPHPALLEELRESHMGRGHRPIPLHPAAVLEDRLAVQHQEIQGLLGDNQRLAATHVALKQELEAAQHELQRMAHFRDSMMAGTEVRLRELYDKSAHLEAELRNVEAMRAELLQIRGDIKELTALRKDLSGQVQAMTQDLARMNADLKRVPALRADVEGMKQELQCARLWLSLLLEILLWVIMVLR